MKIVMLVIVFTLSVFLTSCSDMDENLLHDCPPCDCQPIYTDCPPCDCQPIYITTTVESPIDVVMENLTGMWDDFLRLIHQEVERDKNANVVIEHEEGREWDRVFHLVTDPLFQSYQDIEDFILFHTSREGRTGEQHGDFILSTLLSPYWPIYKEIDGKLFVSAEYERGPLQGTEQNLYFHIFDYFWDYENTPYTIQLLFMNANFDGIPSENPPFCDFCFHNGLPYIIKFLRFEENNWRLCFSVGTWTAFVWYDLWTFMR
ncbi:MAG: hypothetical protein FWB93_00835 [Oscillospiraceae bacterium]|nr:hypothetical protein [Oscillospiraceae bacterium]